MNEAAVSSVRAHAPLRFGWLSPSLLLLALGALLIRVHAPLNHDVAFTLIGAEALLDGGRFGLDVVDPNPPLSWWIAMLPVATARLLGAGLGPASSAFTILLVLASLALCGAILDRLSLAETSRRAFLLFAGAVLLLAPGYDFGQREHLMLIGALPWTAAAALVAEGRSAPLTLRLLVGLCSGLAFCLKPHFLLVPVAVELWLLLNTRDLRLLLRPEALMLAATGSAYGLAILLLAPDYLQTVVPRAAAVYWAFDGSTSDLLTRFASTLLPLLAAGLILHRQAGRAPPLALALVAASGGGFAAALLQHKGWNYHWVPGLGLAGFALAALYLASPTWRRPRGVVIAALLLGLVGIFGKAARETAADLSPAGTARQVERLAAAIRTEGGVEASVFAFATSPRDLHPALIAGGARWSAPACCLQWIPADVRAGERGPERAAQIRALARASSDQLMRHLEQTRPDLILVDDRPAKLGFGNRPFDYQAYFLASARFRTFWTGYEERDRVMGYRIFRRR